MKQETRSAPSQQYSLVRTWVRVN